MHAVGELAQKRNAGVPHGYGNAGTTNKARRAGEPRRRSSRRRAANAGRRRSPPRHGAREGERARDEAVRRRVAVGPQEAHALFHRREARRLPRARARAGVDVPHADRAQADRRARRGEAARRRRPLRPPVLLGVVAARAATGQPRRRQGSAPVAQPVADLRRVRAADVLPALRARVLRAEPQALSEGRQDRRHDASGEEKVIANDIFRERVTLRADDGEQRTILLAELRAEAEEVGAPLPFAPVRGS